jgi:transposase
MTLEDFELAKALCRRWSKESIGMAKLVLVDGLDMLVVAERFDVKPQQVRVIKKRFEEKLTEAKIKKFTLRVLPASVCKHEAEIKRLNQLGYTANQIAVYLKEQSVDCDEKIIDAFLKG